MNRVLGIAFFLGVGMIGLSNEVRVLAQTAPAASSSSVPTQQESPTPESSPGRRKLRDKEAEGSKAPNRFETDTVLKSQYTLDGQPLEVDPD